MKEAHTTRVEQTDRELRFTRIFNAPRQLVFAVFTKPEHLARWWGPKGWTLPVCTIDFRPGGVWHYCLRSAEGEEKWVKATYQEIIEPERIVYTDSFVDASGNLIDNQPEKVTTVTLVEQEGGTKLTSRIRYARADDLKTMLALGMVPGTIESWNYLEQYLADLGA